MSQLLWNVFTNFFPHFPEAFMQLMYALANMCYSILDFLQLLFRMVSGLEVYGMGEAGLVSGDIFYQIFSKTFLTGGLNGGMWGTDGQYSVLAIAFWSMVILCAILLFVSTIAAIIKNEYSPDKEKKNSKAGIIKNFFKAIASFFLVPIACYFGLRLGNAVLYALDSAVVSSIGYTLNGEDISGYSNNFEKAIIASYDDDGNRTSVESYSYFEFFGSHAAMKYPSIAGLVNKTCLYGASRIRNGSLYNTDISGGKTGSLGFLDSMDQDKAANAIDTAFMLNVKLKNGFNLIDGEQGTFYQSDDYDSWSGKATTGSYMDRSNVELISYYYNLTQYNLILAVLFIYIGMKSLFNISMGLIGRIMTLLAMLFIEPIPLAYMPIDNGGAFGRWTQRFFGQFVGIFSINLTMSVFYMVCPVFTSIDFLASRPELGFATPIVHALFIIALLAMLSKIDEMILFVLAGKEAGPSVSAMGETVGAQVKQAAQTTARVAMTGAKVAGHAAMGAARLGVAGVRAGMAGVSAAKTGLSNRNARNAHNEAEGHRHNMNEAQRRANVTDAQIMSGAADREYSRMHGEAMDQAYDKYQKRAGDTAMSREDWETNTGSSSLMAAQSSGAKTEAEQRAFFDRTHEGASDADYAKWKSDGQAAIDQYKSLHMSTNKTGNSAFGAENKFEKANGDQATFRANSVTAMESGNTSGLSSRMMDDFHEGQNQRAAAQAEVNRERTAMNDALSRETDHRREAEQHRESRRYNMGRVRGNLRSSLHHAGDSVGALGGLLPPQQR